MCKEPENHRSYQKKDARKSIREHRQILRAIKDRDAEMAEQLANEHIIHVMQNLKKQGY